MALEDFEKSLVEAKRGEKDRREEKSHRKHRHHHHHGSHRRDEGEDEHRHKRRRKSIDEDDAKDHGKHKSRGDQNGMEGKSKDDEELSIRPTTLKRDSWMQAPSALDVEIVHRKDNIAKQPSSRDSRVEFERKIHQSELDKQHLQDIEKEEAEAASAEQSANHEVDYVFGDAGSQWRMTKLKSVYRQAEETGQLVEAAAVKQYGELRAFDDAREEEAELDRRATYGESYVGKEKPSGELFQERKLDLGMRRQAEDSDLDQPETSIQDVETKEPPRKTAIDLSELNRLKAKMMKAKLRGGPDAAKLEAEYNAAASGTIVTNDPGVLVLGTMENRMLAGGRDGEVKAITNKRGRERGLVEENNDMSIEDMVREERKTRGQAGGEGLRLAERIAKDGKFDNDLDYMDENANKLAKRVHQSETNLKNRAVTDFQKISRVMDNCPLCHHEDTDTPPTAPVVSLATRVYLTLPTEPELCKTGAVIVPIQHRTNLLECDDDEWEEIRNFMKSLTRMYHARDCIPIFYENAARPHRHPHAALVAVPLPPHLHDQSPAFFREAILSSAPEWSQHKKLIDTAAAARDRGMGRMAFRRSLAKEMPYFHVWFGLDGGLGHVVEDEKTWPKGDLFAREVLGGMLKVDGQVVRRQGKWVRGDQRVEGFRKRWKDFDWTGA
ncbi:hypothetical protein MMC10_005968 [Thelotrema lepadinum]|nr:hypothetical protein [Thelotrema lepadinum]